MNSQEPTITLSHEAALLAGQHATRRIYAGQLRSWTDTADKRDGGCTNSCEHSTAADARADGHPADIGISAVCACTSSCTDHGGIHATVG